MYFHFRNNSGWMSNPCGLIYFHGRYHLYFQHFPHAPRYGKMHWGHAISENLVKWEEKEIAISPDRDNEEIRGCRGGSVICSNDKIYAFYGTDDSISIAVSEDGFDFTKKDKRITDDRIKNPEDPKVFKYKGKYKMLIADHSEGIGKIHLMESEDLINWVYLDIIYSNRHLGVPFECPDLFQIEDRWILMLQTGLKMPHMVKFAYVDFDGKSISFQNPNDPFFTLESGQDFWYPHTFEDQTGRRIVIGWVYSRTINNYKNNQVGLLSVPREISLDMNDNLIMLPIDELMARTVKESRFVAYDQGRLRISFEGKTLFSKAYKEAPEMLVLEDIGIVEVFLNKGRETITMVIC